MKKIAVLLIAAVLLSATPALAGGSFRDGSAESVVFDTVVVRPGAIVLTALGAAAFVGTLPFTCWSGERIDKAAETLVIKPARYTFTRPLGEDF